MKPHKRRIPHTFCPRAAADARTAMWYQEFGYMPNAMLFWNLAIDGGIVIC